MIKKDVMNIVMIVILKKIFLDIRVNISLCEVFLQTVNFDDRRRHIFVKVTVLFNIITYHLATEIHWKKR